jgi:glycosyltransferase involved in cell wall biosynthesis
LGEEVEDKGNVKGRKLLIVSDTAMWQNENGNIAFEPVVREIEHFYSLFSSITWIGSKYPAGKIRGNARAFAPGINVKFIMTNRTGGSTLKDKIRKLFSIPVITVLVAKEIARADVIHTRAPSLQAFIALILSFFYRKKIFWNKYAGNWIEKHPPFFYNLNRLALKMATHTNVVINGTWPGLPSHFRNFPNPCLSEEEIRSASQFAESRNWNQKYKICFVGNLEPSKGCDKLLVSLNALPEETRAMIEEVIIVGNGSMRKELESYPSLLRLEFKGFQKREEINKIYAESHFIVLPSDSEGFPKVIAEAAAFGCIPVVSNVSCVDQYINASNGFLWNLDEDLTTILKTALSAPVGTLIKRSEKLRDLSHVFSYRFYFEKIRNEILGVPSITQNNSPVSGLNK